MSHTVFLHIGAMKSGTSFLQGTLHHNRDELAAQGRLFPGATWRHQVLAVLDVLGQQRDGRPVPGSEGAWQRLVDEVAAFDGASVVSMEFLGPTPPDDIARVVESLRPAEVQVVMTVRDLARNVPAMWQEGLKNGLSWSWPDYLQLVRNGPSPDREAKRFWRHMNAPFIARKWVEAVGAERFTLVTVPHPGAPPRTLWDRFCSAVGLDPEPFAFAGRANTSLGAASAQLLRALNEALAGRVDVATHQRVVKHALAQRHLEPHGADEPRIGFDEPWIAEHAQRQIDRLGRLGVRVVGDLDELQPVPIAGVDPSTVPAEEQLAAAVGSLAYLVELWPSP